MRTVNIHCDGACLENGLASAIGGYGIVVESNGKIIDTKFGKLRAGTQTNNRAELEAMLQALNYVLETEIKDIDKQYVIYSDSTTTVDGILGTARRKANRDIWTDIEKVCSKLNEFGYDVTVKHCNKEFMQETDNNYQMNVLADSLAFRGANALIIC